MIIDTFLGALLGNSGPLSAADAHKDTQIRQTRAALEADAKRLAEDYASATRARSDAVIEMLTYRAKLRGAESRASILRTKLEQIRPYVVAAARGSSLQARGDLAALDAVLRSTKP